MEEERKRDYKLLSRFEGYKKAKTCVLSCLIQFIDYASVQSLTLYIEEINIIIVLVQGLNKTSFIPSFSTWLVIFTHHFTFLSNPYLHAAQRIVASSERVIVKEKGIFITIMAKNDKTVKNQCSPFCPFTIDLFRDWPPDFGIKTTGIEISWAEVPFSQPISASSTRINSNTDRKQKWQSLQKEEDKLPTPQHSNNLINYNLLRHLSPTGLLHLQTVQLQPSLWSHNHRALPWQ